MRRVHALSPASASRHSRSATLNVTFSFIMVSPPPMIWALKTLSEVLPVISPAERRLRISPPARLCAYQADQ